MQYTNTHRVNLHQQQAPTATAFTSGPSSSSSDRRRQRLPPPLHAATQQPDHKQLAAPLLDAVLARGNQLQETPLHVPGHKVRAAAAAAATTPHRCHRHVLSCRLFLCHLCSVAERWTLACSSCWGCQGQTQLNTHSRRRLLCAAT